MDNLIVIEADKIIMLENSLFLRQNKYNLSTILSTKQIAN